MTSSRRGLSLALIVVLLFPVSFLAQSAQSNGSHPSTSVPRLINVTGVFRPADGRQPAQVETVTLGIYQDETGGAPLWQETQTIALDAQGRYSLLLGATQADGIPPRCLAPATPMAGHRVRARRRSRRAARPDHQRSVCAALVRCRHTRRPARLGVPARAGRRRHDGRARRRASSTAGGEHRRLSCCPARPTFSPST